MMSPQMGNLGKADGEGPRAGSPLRGDRPRLAVSREFVKVPTCSRPLMWA